MKNFLRRLKTIYRLSFLPGHFYSPVFLPDEITEAENKLFSQKESDVKGINLNEGMQFSLLEDLKKFYVDIPFTFEATDKHRYFYNNSFFSYNSGIELFCIIRHFKPKRIIEVGSGFSSALMLDTNELFFNNEIALSFIEPFPEIRLDKLMKVEDRATVRVFGQRLQEIDLNIFSQLDRNDLLFIDSSHVSKFGSDVNTIFFQILPILKPGVIIHFHDIFFPFEYPRNWVMDKGGFGWNELYLLRAFLMDNPNYEIIFFNSFLEEKYRDWFLNNMPLCLKRQGGSIYLRKK